jgi:hypothetical protein
MRPIEGELPVERAVGSASLWVLGQVAGPPRTAAVLHAGRDAVYLDLDGRCIAVLAARAVLVPCGVRTLLPALPPVATGDQGVVADGSVRLPGCEVLVTQIVDTAVPVLAPAAVAWGATHLAPMVVPWLAETRRDLPQSAQAGLVQGDAACVPALLGLGPGLTPLGDDVLAGWLAAAVAARHPRLDAVRSTVALQASGRTTTLSTTLLACAARGEGIPQLRDLLVGVTRQDLGAVERSARDLLEVGDTSGAGLLLGVAAALEGAALEVAA